MEEFVVSNPILVQYLHSITAEEFIPGWNARGARQESC